MAKKLKVYEKPAFKVGVKEIDYLRDCVCPLAKQAWGSYADGSLKAVFMARDTARKSARWLKKVYGSAAVHRVSVIQGDRVR